MWVKRVAAVQSTARQAVCRQSPSAPMSRKRGVRRRLRPAVLVAGPAASAKQASFFHSNRRRFRKPVAGFQTPFQEGDKMNDYQRFGKNPESTTRSHVGLGLTLLLIGLGAGAAAALLLAPKEGKKTRRMLRRKYEEAVDAFAEWRETAEDMLGRGSEWTDMASERIKSKVAPIRRAVGR